MRDFFRDNNSNLILDPLSCVIRISVLSFKPIGTKISINNNKISYNDPCILQGTIRWSYGDNREDLHNICNPLQKCVDWYDKTDDKLKNIFELAIVGLEKLKESYKSNSTIHHSIDRYISIIKDSVVKKTRSSSSSTETNHIFEELKNLWNDREITIVNNLLLEIQENFKNKDVLQSLLLSLDSLLNMKEQKVRDIIIRTTTILE